jgi:hypothetical protein
MLCPREDNVNIFRTEEVFEYFEVIRDTINNRAVG